MAQASVAANGQRSLPGAYFPGSVSDPFRRHRLATLSAPGHRVASGEVVPFSEVGR